MSAPQSRQFRAVPISMILMPVVVDLPIHRGSVRSRDCRSLLVLGIGSGLGLLSGTQRKRRKEPVQLVAAAGGAGRGRVAVAWGANQYFKLVRA